MRLTGRASNITAYCALIATITILSWVLYFSGRGIDFTDEGFYLNWISNPYQYSWSLSQFGFIYLPLYRLVDGDIAWLRCSNIAITFCLAWWLTDTIFSNFLLDDPRPTHKRLIISSGFATAALISLTVSGTWLPTPSYNSLTLQGLIIVIGGLATVANRERFAMTDCITIGLGGWLVFMAKPSSAALIGGLAALHILMLGRSKVRTLLGSATTVLLLLLITSILMDGSPWAFAIRIHTALELSQYLSSNHSLSDALRVDDFTLSPPLKLALAVLTAICTLITLCCMSTHRLVRMIGVSSCCLLTSAIAITAFGLVRGLTLGAFSEMLILAVAGAAISLGILAARSNTCPKTLIPLVALTILLLLMPHVYAFGTGNNYWQQGAAIGLFWLLGALLVCVGVGTPKAKEFWLPLTLTTQLIVILLLHTSILAPYRQAQPLRENTDAIAFGKPNAVIHLSPSYAQYIRDIHASAKQAGLQKGDAIIDLTGQSPGVLYALQTISLGQAWIIGGYPGSLTMAAKALEREPCKALARAWILDEPEGPRKIPSELLSSFGAEAGASHYSVAAEWMTPSGAGGYTEQRRQVLLKPIRDPELAIQTCLAARESP